MKQKYILRGIFLFLFVLCGCSRGDGLPEKVQVTSRITEVSSPKPSEYVTSEPVPSVTSEPVRDPMILTMPESKVVKAKQNEELILIDEIHFSDAGFRKYLLQQVDNDGDGFLSIAERECVTSISWDVNEYEYKYGEKLGYSVVLDGLDWFSKLESLSIMTAGDVFLINHPSIRYINGGEGSANIWVDSCEKLEGMYFNIYGGSIYVNNCVRLEKFLCFETRFSAIHFSETPVLKVQMDYTNAYPEIFQLDADAYFLPGLYGGLGFEVSEDGLPYWHDYDVSYRIEWLNIAKENKYKKELEELVARARKHLVSPKVSYIEKKNKDSLTEGKNIYVIYFDGLGDDTKNSWETPSNSVEFETETEIDIGNLSFGLNGTEKVQTISYSPNRGFIQKVKIGATVYYTEHGVSKNLGDIAAVCFYSKDENGVVVEYRELDEVRMILGIEN